MRTAFAVLVGFYCFIAIQALAVVSPTASTVWSYVSFSRIASIQTALTVQISSLYTFVSARQSFPSLLSSNVLPQSLPDATPSLLDPLATLLSRRTQILWRSKRHRMVIPTPHEPSSSVKPLRHLSPSKRRRSLHSPAQHLHRNFDQFPNSFLPFLPPHWPTQDRRRLPDLPLCAR